MLKRIIKITIIAGWAALMGWWWQESRSWPVPDKIEAAFLPDSNDYYSLQYGDSKFGWGFKSLRRLPGGFYNASQGLTVLINSGGEEPLSVRLESIINLDEALNLIDFQYLIQAGSFQAMERGKVENGVLTVGVNLGEHGTVLRAFLDEYGALLGSYAKTLDFDKDIQSRAPQGPLLAAMAWPYLSYIGLEKDRSYSIEVLDPLNRRPSPLNIKVVGQNKQLDVESGLNIDVYELLAGVPGQESRLVIDRFGRVIREEGLGLAMVKTGDQAEALKDISPLTPPDSLGRFLSGRNVQDIFKNIKKTGAGPAS